MRSTIRKAPPEAAEMIAYQIPTYKLHGRPVLYFAGWKKHYSLYPATGHVVAAFNFITRYRGRFRDSPLHLGVKR